MVAVGDGSGVKVTVAVGRGILVGVLVDVGVGVLVLVGVLVDVGIGVFVGFMVAVFVAVTVSAGPGDAIEHPARVITSRTTKNETRNLYVGINIT